MARHVSRQSVELGNHNRTFCGSRRGQGRRKLRSAIEGVSALARFRLYVFGQDVELLGAAEAGISSPSGLDPEAGRCWRSVETR
jgi:hypothetical protein